MAIKTVQDSSLTAVANAIRAKGETEALLEFPNGFVTAIENLPKGTGEVTIATDGAVTQGLQTNTAYHFTSTALTSLTITFAGDANGQYHFDFISPATAVTLTLPASVTMETPFSVEVNTKYEIDIYQGYGVFAEWAVQ